ncbi:YraN family protein [Sinomicrobium oceani]|uniref:YraN family protein n=1 Tax=Sinomicrobium oceani TaxID=1150368 RepID=UPI00227CF00A|nr:YraN family protein [Sinomicrobium oceani]
MATHNDFGKKGEEMAVQFLLQNGYTIIERNYVFDKAEIDIIAEKEDILAVIEVKARNSADYGNPQDAVNRKKIQHLVKAIDHYIVTNNIQEEVRFDIIAITRKGKKHTLEHLKDAFYHF